LTLEQANRILTYLQARSARRLMNPYTSRTKVRCHPDPQATPATFAPRAVFGRYIQLLLSEKPEIEQVRSSVNDCRLDGAGAVLALEDGRKLNVDRVVLATGNFDPAPAVARLRVMRLDQRKQLAPRNHLIHLIQKQFPFALAGMPLKARLKCQCLLKMRPSFHPAILSKYNAAPRLAQSFLSEEEDSRGVAKR
jgi:hypothetical protein